MSNQNTSRRGFFQKLGVTVGAAALIEKEAFADINPNRFSTKQERRKFLDNYKVWVNEYIQVVDHEKSNNTNILNKHKIMELSAQADGWQEQIKEYLKEDDFKQEYIALSKQFADAITPELEA